MDDLRALSASIRKLARAEGCKVSTSMYYRTMTVTFKTIPSKELVDYIKALETSEAHGDIMDDTRYYTGISIQFSYDFWISEDDMSMARKIKNQWSFDGKSWGELRSIYWHIENEIKETLGVVGKAIMQKHQVECL